MTYTAILPTSVTNASLSGSTVYFANATSIDVAGVFPSGSNNTQLICQFNTTADAVIAARLLTSGSAASANYSGLTYLLDGTSQTLGTADTTYFDFGVFNSGTLNGADISIGNAASATSTRFHGHRSIPVLNGARQYIRAATHTVAVAYNDIRIFPVSGSFTGSINFYCYQG